MRAFAPARGSIRLLTCAGWLCASLLVGGCASHRAYPQHWPPFAKHVQTCGVLNGEYRNQGETGDGQLTWLSRLLFDRPVSIDSMKLFVPEGDHPGARAELAGLEPVEFPREMLSCVDGMLLVRLGGRWFGAGSEFGLFSVGRRSTTLELHAAANALVIRVKTRTNGVITAIPWTSSDQTWHRFERLARQ